MGAIHFGISVIGSGPYLPGEMGEIWDRFCGGRFRAVIDSVFGLSEAARAPGPTSRCRATTSSARFCSDPEGARPQ